MSEQINLDDFVMKQAGQASADSAGKGGYPVSDNDDAVIYRLHGEMIEEGFDIDAGDSDEVCMGCTWVQFLDQLHPHLSEQIYAAVAMHIEFTLDEFKDGDEEARHALTHLLPIAQEISDDLYQRALAALQADEDEEESQ